MTLCRTTRSCRGTCRDRTFGPSRTHPGSTAESVRTPSSGAIVDRMSPLNAAFRQPEDADQNASPAIAPIAILEGPPPSYEQRRSSTCRRGSDRDGLGLIPTSPLRNRRGGLASRGMYSRAATPALEHPSRAMAGAVHLRLALSCDGRINRQDLGAIDLRSGLAVRRGLRGGPGRRCSAWEQRMISRLDRPSWCGVLGGHRERRHGAGRRGRDQAA